MGAPLYGALGATAARVNAQKGGIQQGSPEYQAAIRRGLVNGLGPTARGVPASMLGQSPAPSSAPVVAQAPGTPNPTTAAKKRRSGTILTNPQGLTSTQSAGTTLVSA